MPIRATVWGENVHEQKNKAVAENYPKGMHGQIAGVLEQDPNIKASTVVLQDPEHGMTEAKLNETDVLLWWGHAAHDKVDDAIVERVAQRVWGGMGLIVLHSGHFSKIFKRLMGAPCALHWREAGERERLETVFVSWFQGGEVFRSGLTYRRGAGNIFYFRPGHETYPTYHDKTVGQVLRNAVNWAYNPERHPELLTAPNTPVDKAIEHIVERGAKLTNHPKAYSKSSRMRLLVLGT